MGDGLRPANYVRGAPSNNVRTLTRRTGERVIFLLRHQSERSER